MHYKTHRTFSHLLCFRGKLENSHKAVLVRQPEAGRLGDPTKGQKFQNELRSHRFSQNMNEKLSEFLPSSVMASNLSTFRQGCRVSNLGIQNSVDLYLKY